MGRTALKPPVASVEVSSTPLLRRLEQFHTLTPAEREFIAGLTARRSAHAPGEELCCQGEPTRTPRLIVSGWGCQMRILTDGRRQIFNFLIPGDLIWLSSRAEPLALFTTCAVTPMVTVTAAALANVLRAGVQTGSSLAAALLEAESAEESMLFDHMVRLGRLTAYERTAHLLLELRHRLARVGLGEVRFPLPLTQELMADALGLSLVHVNRTLKQLRRDRLLVLRAGSAELPDLARLTKLARYAAP